MTIEEQVCNKELAIKLHKLHVTKPSLFYWEWTGATKIERWENGKPDYCEDNICAYTVAELGEMLPTGLWSGKQNDEKIVCWNQTFQTTLDEDIEFYGDTEADARAKMLIYLLENKLITL